MQEITSAQNAQIKILRCLGNKKGRETYGLFVAEGYNLVKDMPDKTCALYVRGSDAGKYAALIGLWQGETTLVADAVFDSISDTVNTCGVLAAAPIPKAKPLTGGIALVLDGIADPGNAGTIVRTACAFGVTDIVSVSSADFYNPKTVRSTMGGVFFANLIEAEREAAEELLADYDIAVLDMNGSDVYYYKPPPKLALVVGSEAHGVSETFRRLSAATLAVPMYGGRIESLNAAVSVSIALSAVTHKLHQ